MKRIKQATLIVSTLLLSWLLLQAVHEFGHILAARATGGRVEHVVVHPLRISRTDVQPNPYPSIVAWGGPILGALLPLAALAIFAIARLPNGFLQFFAGFCLIANGAYIAFGSFNRIGDCGEMQRTGSPIWALWIFGAITIPLGLIFWNGCRNYFGLGPNGKTSRIALGATIVAFVVLAAAEALLSPR